MDTNMAVCAPTVTCLLPTAFIVHCAFTCHLFGNHQCRQCAMLRPLPSPLLHCVVLTPWTCSIMDSMG